MTGEIAVDRLVVEPVRRLGMNRMGSGADQRQITVEHHVEKLRQLVEAGLADETPDAGDPRIVPGHELRRGRVGLVGVHRAELEHLDQLVVEAVALLLEEDRSAAVEPDRERDQRHHRRGGEKREAADQLVEQPLHHDVPVGDRPVGDVEHRHVADVGIGTWAELQLVRVRREADVDRQHPQLLEHLQDARFRRYWQREDHKVDAGESGELDEVIDSAELGLAGTQDRRAVFAAVIEQADEAHVAVGLRVERRDQRFARAAAADDDGAPLEPPLGGPMVDQTIEAHAKADDGDRADREEAGKPYPRVKIAEPRKEHDGGNDQEHHGERNDEPRAFAERPPERLYVVDVGGLKREHGQRGNPERGDGVIPTEPVGFDHIGKIDADADRRDQRTFDDAHDAGEHDRR